MKRDIFVVNAHIVDANGTFNQLSGYPKAFDSRHYDNDIEKTRQRAFSDYYETLSGMYKRDDREVQNISLTQVSTGVTFSVHNIGELAELPDPEEAAQE